MKTKIIMKKAGYTKPGSKMAASVYKDKPVRVSKTVVKSNGKVKTVTYGPVDYYGKQTKTKIKTKNGKVY